MKLKRKHARLINVVLVVTLLSLFLLMILDVAGAPLAATITLVSIAMIGTILVLVLRFWLLSCPNCGQSAARPYWNPGESHRQFCPKCGKPFIYDDEPDEGQ